MTEHTTNAAEELACAVPLVELLRRIPVDYRAQWTDADGLQASHSAPVGMYCHQAADALTTQADNVLRSVLGNLDMALDLICEAKGAEGPGGGFVTDHLDSAEGWINQAIAALKAPTTEPNPNEGMQVAERRAIVAWLRHDDIGEWHRLDQSIEHTLADAIERGDHLSTLTSASNPEGLKVAEAEADGWEKGMREAANICGSLAETTYDDADAFEAATGCEAAIVSNLRAHQRSRAAPASRSTLTDTPSHGQDDIASGEQSTLR